LEVELLMNEQEWRPDMRFTKEIKLVGMLVLAAISLLLAGCDSGAPDVDWELGITGDVATPITVSYKALADMPQVELDEVMMEKSTGEDEVTSWSGVPVAQLFDQAGAPESFSSVTALAADGYAIEITSDEIAGAIVALRDQGEWIAQVSPNKGPIRLVCPQTPGNRWVFQLIELQIHQ
jgi:DMSO/TMAO reductase YedYZ molybdopterin-dependent catalytic subunit